MICRLENGNTHSRITTETKEVLKKKVRRETFPFDCFLIVLLCRLMLPKESFLGFLSTKKSQKQSCVFKWKKEKND